MIIQKKVYTLILTNPMRQQWHFPEQFGAITYWESPQVFFFIKLAFHSI